MNIQERIGKYILERRSPNYKRKGYKGWDQVKTVLVVGNIDSDFREREYFRMRRVFKEEGKELNVIMYSSESKEEFEGSFKHQKIGKKALNFWKLPKADLVREYASKTYDLLICVSDAPDLPIEFLVNRIPAKFRIGLSGNTNLKFDLIVFRKGSLKLEHYIEDLISYLKRINNQQELDK